MSNTQTSPRRLNTHQAAALTSFILSVRGTEVMGAKSGWSKSGIENAIEKAGELGTPQAVALAVVAAACNPQAKSPAFVLQPGPHWLDLAPKPDFAKHTCAFHPNQPTACPVCRAAEDNAVKDPTRARQLREAGKAAGKAQRDAELTQAGF